MASILLNIRSLLDSNGIPYRECQHEPTYTSEQSANARGEALETGAKALLLKTNDCFRLFVMPANRKLDSKSLKRELSTKSIRFATAEELADLTGLVPGCVPPFGEPILPFELFADSAIESNEKVAFNAGSLTDSIIMQADDYLKIAKPVLFPFSKV